MYVLEDMSLPFKFSSELHKTSVTSHAVLQTSVGVPGWPSGVIFDMYSLSKVAIFLSEEGSSTLNKGPWRTQQALSCQAGERTEVRQPTRNERIDEGSIVVAILDFLHGAIMPLLQLATL